MKTTKSLIAMLATVTATLLFQIPISRADDHDDHGSRGQNEKGGHDRPLTSRFVILLSGVYQPVPLGHGPKGNLGLTTVSLGDGSFSKNKIYPVSGIPGNPEKANGTFYVQFGVNLCAYALPGGSISAMFTMMNDVTTAYEESADGSWTLDGTFELDILEATGIYSSFAGGHVHMVDILKFRAGDGTFLEDCFCNIHPKLQKP